MEASERVRVAIIGAGPSGLVAAKTLMQFRLQRPSSEDIPSQPERERYEITVFEKSDRVGGLWPTEPDEDGSFIDPLMPTNLSKFSVAFSDLDWTSVDLQTESRTLCLVYEGSAASPRAHRHTTAYQPGDSREQLGGDIPLYPRAWMVGRYLKAYAEKNNLTGLIKLQHQVVSAVREEEHDRERWKLVVRNSDKSNATSQAPQQQTLFFDKLIIATGFFAVPKQPPTSRITGPGKAADAATRLKIIHSSAYRSLDNVLPADWPFRSAEKSQIKIVVVGGANSAGEAAAAIAKDIQKARLEGERHKSNVDESRGLTVHHVTPHALYPVPLLLQGRPHVDGQTELLPRDYFFYDLGARLPGPIVSSAGMAPVEEMKARHAGMTALLGFDVHDLHPALAPTDVENGEPVHVTLCDKYADLVRSKDIVPVRGRLSTIGDRGDSNELNHGATIVLDDGTRISDVVAVVFANGFSSSPASSVLDDETLKKLDYDADNLRIPFLLQDYQTANSAVSSLAFVGMFEGLNWGVVEMQARIVAHKWAMEAYQTQSEHGEMLQNSFEGQETMQALRKAFKDRDPRAPQYWFSDHAGYMEEIAHALKLPRMNEMFGMRSGPAVAARYLTPASSEVLERAREQASKTVNQAWSILHVENRAFICTDHRRLS